MSEGTQMLWYVGGGDTRMSRAPIYWGHPDVGGHPDVTEEIQCHRILSPKALIWFENKTTIFGVPIFRFRRMDKMDSVVKGLMGQSFG